MARVRNRPGTNLSRLAARAAERAASQPPVSRNSRPAADLLARPITSVPGAPGPVRRTSTAPLTPMQRDSTGKPSAWNDPIHRFDPVTVDSRWSQTLQNQAV